VQIALHGEAARGVVDDLLEPKADGSVGDGRDQPTDGLEGAKSRNVS